MGKTDSCERQGNQQASRQQSGGILEYGVAG
jgi:hypothetical protein